VAGAALLRRESPALDRRIGLVLTFFCAGTPSTRGTLDLLRELEVDPGELSGLRYRGLGWPGGFRPELRDGGTRFLSYQESWGRLTAYRPLRCHLCPDGLGRLADISCGDAWHRHAGPGEADPGRSLVLVRTPLGRRILAEAAAAGYVHLEPSGPREVLRAQADLLQRRRQLHGRLLAFRLLGLPVPRYRGFALRSSWRRLPAGERFRVVAGTLRRILRRGWWRPWQPGWQ
jgi:coenzyme F420 hydrogenase subunit beta